MAAEQQKLQTVDLKAHMDQQFETAQAQMLAHTDLAVQREGLIAARCGEL
jgi:hypothetical protein